MPGRQVAEVPQDLQEGLQRGHGASTPCYGGTEGPREDFAHLKMIESEEIESRFKVGENSLQVRGSFAL